jgi:hypothetical protein
LEVCHASGVPSGGQGGLSSHCPRRVQAVIVDDASAVDVQCADPRLRGRQAVPAAPPYSRPSLMPVG